MMFNDNFRNPTTELIEDAEVFEKELNNMDIVSETVEVTKISYPVLLNKKYVDNKKILTPYVLATAYFEDDELISSPKHNIEQELEMIKLKERIEELEEQVVEAEAHIENLKRDMQCG